MQPFYLIQPHRTPKFLMNRKYLLPLALLLFTFILAACGGGEDFSAPNQPNLSLQAGEQSDAGLRTVACWPKGENNVSCEFTSNADSPSTTLAVQGGQAVTVAIANPEGVALPNQVVITSRETDAAGNPLFTMQIDPAQSTEFVLALPSGRYLLDVTAYYADIEGSSATVSNVFAVDVGQAVAGNVTPEPTEAVTPAATPEVTAEVTEVATEVTTPEATVESTPEATAESTEIATVEATPEATEATPQATEDTGTGGGDETETPEATEEVIEPTAEPTEVATEPVSTEEVATATEEATEPATPISPIIITPVATEEVVTPTETATEVATETATPTEEVTEVVAPPTNTATPSPSPTTAVPPTATSTPTATPTLGVSPTNTSVFEVDAPPAAALKVSGRNYQPVGYDYCRRNASNELVCVKQPFSATGSTATSIRAARNAAANIRIEGSRPTSIEINYLSRDTLQPIASETRVGDNVVLFNLGVAAGSYILAVEIVWPDMTVTYYFQLQVLQ